MPKLLLGKDTFSVDALDPERAFDLQPRLVPALAEFIVLYGMFLAEGKVLLDKAKGDEADGDAPERPDFKKLVETDALSAVEHFLPFAQRAAPVVASICAKLPPAELKAIRRELLDGATADNGVALFSPQGSPYNVILRGRLFDQWRLLIFALEVNYPDFFGALAGPAAPSAAASPSAP